MATNKGFLKDWSGNLLLPITRGELVLDRNGLIALNSVDFLATLEHPGLMSAAEKAMLSGSGNGQSLTDIYTKLQYINTGLKVNGSPLNFYNTSTGEQTSINITLTGGLVLGSTDNGVQIGLKELTTNETSISQIIKSITVDKYGRVTAVTGSPLTNDEIPTELSGKTITNSTLSGCVTADDDIGTDSKAIVNKKYVDTAIQNVSGIATGALKFGGAISDSQTAIDKLSNTDNNNSYYKVTSDFVLDSSYLYSETTTVNNYGKIKAGDTLIIYTAEGSTAKYVHVPSGDDYTYITVKEAGEDVVTSLFGNISFNFSSLFDVSIPTTGSLNISITLNKASNTLDGYLSLSDYIKFSSYATNLATTYESIIASSDAGAYAIGTLSVGELDYTLYGKNNISALTLNNGTTDSYNPILRFSETGATDVDITLKGSSSISVKKVDNSVEFASTLAIDTTSTKYLELSTDHKLKAKIGSVSGTTITDGLTDYAEFVQLKSAVLTKGVIFESITYSLSDEATPGESDPYRYGNDALIAALNVTI